LSVSDERAVLRAPIAIFGGAFMSVPGQQRRPRKIVFLYAAALFLQRFDASRFQSWRCTAAAHRRTPAQFHAFYVGRVGDVFADKYKR